MIMTMVSGSRKNAWPTTSMVLRSHFGSRLFTMSMRMCSLASSVHGEHSRNTMLNSTHCSSSQEFDDVSKILRTVALAAETSTAARISQDRRLPIQVLIASIRRLNGRSALRIESTSGSPPGGPRDRPRLLHPPRPTGAAPGRARPANPKGPAPVN